MQSSPSLIEKYSNYTEVLLKNVAAVGISCGFYGHVVFAVVVLSTEGIWGR